MNLLRGNVRHVTGSRESSGDVTGRSPATKNAMIGVNTCLISSESEIGVGNVPNRPKLNESARKFLEASGRKFCRVLRGNVLSVQQWGIDFMEPTGETIDASGLDLPPVGEFCIVTIDPFAVETFDQC